MARSERKGNRSPRSSRIKRYPSLGYYLIITDTKNTEKKYFTGFRNSLDPEIQKKLVIRIIPKVKQKYLIEACKEEMSRLPQYAKPWVVLDRDQVKDFDSKIKNIKENNIDVGWSNPCIETWFHSYFEEPFNTDNSVMCNRKFEKIFKNQTDSEMGKAILSIDTSEKIRLRNP